jgi:hypothetical protein
VGDILSFAFDANDVPHVVFRDPDNDRLWYSRRGPGGWVNEIVVQGTSGTRDCAIAVDGNGDPHIAYVQNTPFLMRHAVKSGGTWTYETVDSTGTPTLSASSIRVDAAGVPHIAYLECGSGELAFASRTGGAWASAIVDPGSGSVTTGYWPSLELDASDAPHIGQVHQADSEVWYTTRNGGTWSSELVSSAYPNCSETVLSIDAFENPGIVFRAQNAGYLVYAYGAVNTDVAPGALTRVAFTAGPNPAPGGRTAFSFVVPAGVSRTSVRITDVAGREVRRLGARSSGPGPRRLDWDGRAGHGVAPPPGIYHARLEMDGQTVASLRIALLR